MTNLILNQVGVVRGDRRVLEGADVTFQAGRLAAVIGPNGAGKSTLLSVAAGLLQPSTGQVRLGDTQLAAMPRRVLAQRRAYLPQRAGVEWPISVERVVALGLTPSLPAFGELPARPATELSGGELARVMMARATVGEPELLIVDEPTAGLDPRHAVEVGRRLRALSDGGCTVVIALHDLDLARRIADDVVALKDGRVLASGPTRTVFTADTLSALFDAAIEVIGDGGIRYRDW